MVGLEKVLKVSFSAKSLVQSSGANEDFFRIIIMAVRNT